MTRPAFQFYTGDWQKNAKLRRCSHAARGAWIDVLCLLHDSEDEYGVLRWPLKDIAQAASAPMPLIRELVSKGVLKGADKDAEPYVYRPKHAGKEGEPVTLVVAGDGPCWYSSRFVRDEWVRQRRGQSTQFSATNQPTKGHEEVAPKASPKGGIGGPQGDGPSSSSSKEKVSKASPSHPPAGGKAVRFDDFWLAWPKNERKQDKAKCLEHWKRHGLDALADVIEADVRTKRGTTKWGDGFIEAPLVYLRGKRWEDGVTPNDGSPAEAAANWWESSPGIRAKGIELTLGDWDEIREQWGPYRARVFAEAGPGPWNAPKPAGLPGVLKTMEPA